MIDSQLLSRAGARCGIRLFVQRVDSEGLEELLEGKDVKRLE